MNEPDSNPQEPRRPARSDRPEPSDTASTQRVLRTPHPNLLPVLEKASGRSGSGSGGGKRSGRSGGPAPATAYNPYEGEDKGRRFWSARRVPAGIVALLTLGGVGLLLYDLASVRAGRQAMQWRKSLADEFATRPLDDVVVLAGAAAATALGLWLLLLALTPGLRWLLPMRRTHDEVRAGLHRGAITLVLRDRAMEVPGVRAAGVRTRRRAVRVRALAHFRELDDVRTDLHTALSQGIRDLGLARPPALTVHVARSDRRG